MAAAALYEHYTALHLHSNATFLCERAHAELGTPESLATLASCYLRQGQAKRAYCILQGSSVGTAQARYLLAISCHKLEKLHEAETALLPDRTIRAKGPKASREVLMGPLSPVPHGAAGLHLLGVLCDETSRKDEAVEYFKMALEKDSMMWCSFEALCQLGARVDVEECFADKRPHALSSVALYNKKQPHLSWMMDQHEEPPMTAARSGFESYPMSVGSSVGRHHHHHHAAETSALRSPPAVKIMNEHSTSRAATPHHPKPRALDRDLDSCARLDSASIAGAIEDEEAPRTTHRKAAKALSFASATTVDTEHSSEKPPRHKMARRDHLMMSSSSSRRMSTSSSTSTPGRKQLQMTSPSIHGEEQEEELLEDEAAFEVEEFEDEEEEEEEQDAHAPFAETRALGRALVGVLRKLGAAFEALSRNRCSAALRLLEQVPTRHYETGWVQHALGRICFESADYKGTLDALRAMQRLEPHRMAGLELLSTALWHLKEEVELCYLARKCIDFDRRSPQAWCAAGNCLSLQKEHDAAIRCFQRAVAVNPRFAYAYTLCGHEYVANEDFEKAVSMYRHAMRIDERHYNAWYGLGAIYYRQEKYELAEYHFERALRLNPQSSVLHCYLGMTLHANKKCGAALEHLRRASSMEPRNPQARFQCANVLISMDKYTEALAELRAVSDHAPREASVHFLMGKVCKKLGRLDEAMMHFTYALDLDPKDNNLIKSAIDRLEDVDISDDEKF